MAFKDAVPFEVKKDGAPAIKAAIKKLASGSSKIIFSINKYALKAYFANAEPGTKFKVRYGQGENQGQAILVPVRDGEVELRRFGSNGGCTLQVAAWHGTMGKEVKSSPCRIMTENEGGVVVKLPWAEGK